MKNHDSFFFFKMVVFSINFFLNIFPAVKIKKTLKNLTVTETQEAVFSVELSHPDVKGALWIKNGVELESNDKYEISVKGTVHTLKIKHCVVTDESVYSFKLGKIGANARLHVESKSVYFECSLECEV